MEYDNTWKPLTLTLVEYPKDDFYGKLLAIISLAPLGIGAGFISLILFRRDLHTITFFLGTLINESLNLMLKYIIQQPRPAIRPHLYVEYGMPSSHTGWFQFLRWSSYEFNMLRSAEKLILSFLKIPYRGAYIDIGPCVGNSDKIWTISMNTESKKTPLVLIHGLGAGSALWVLNYNTLAKNRPVYAIDLLGFGRSSRPEFAKDGSIAERQLVKSIEEWRKEVNLQKYIMLGHSFGGYLSASYALTYPDRVKHLILADPWGFPERPADPSTKYNVPLWARAIGYAVQPLNPLWALRAAGPFGQWVVEKTRPDLTRKFSVIVKDETAIPQYIHQCNSQSPTGESAFHSMMSGFGWAKDPMIKRIHELQEDIPITFLYGSRSWVDNASGETIKALRPKSFVNVELINHAGHHVYADRAEDFNELVLKACSYGEEKDINENLRNDGTESDQENDRQ